MGYDETKLPRCKTVGCDNAARVADPFCFKCEGEALDLLRELRGRRLYRTRWTRGGELLGWSARDDDERYDEDDWREDR